MIVPNDKFRSKKDTHNKKKKLKKKLKWPILFLRAFKIKKTEITTI